MSAKTFFIRTYNSIVNPINFWLSEKRSLEPDGIVSFLDCLRNWWCYRPQVAQCISCGSPMWTNSVDVPYCSEDCVDGSVYDEEIPF